MLTRALSLTSAMGSRRSLFISSLLCAAILLFSWFFSDVQARAEIRIVTASGEHRMGDRDTREDAIKLATEAAKRNALEQVATYLESVTVVHNFDVTQDEIRTYTAGVVLVLDQQITTSLDGETVVIRVDLTAQVDSEDVIRAIAALRKNEDAREELVALKAEVDRLHQELDAVNHALAEATSPEQVREISQLRQEILDKVQSNALVSQAWTDWVIVSPFVGFSPWVNAAPIQALLAQAEQLNPSNPHVRVVQQVLTARVPPTPPQPPAPPAPPHTTLAMPTYQVVPQQPLPLSFPPTLNRLLLAPMKQPRSSSPPADQQPTMPQPASSPLSHPLSQQLSTMTHLTPSLLAPPGSITGSVPPPTHQAPPMPDSPHTSSRKLSSMLQHTPATTLASPPRARGTLPNAKVLPAPDGATSPREQRLSPRLDRLFEPQGASPHLPLESPHIRPFPPGRGLSGSQSGPGHKGAK